MLRCLASLILISPLQGAADLPVVRVKVIVPVPPPAVASGAVTIDGRPAAVHRIESAKQTPAVLVYYPPDFEHYFFEELRGFLARIQPEFPDEVWSSLGSGDNELSAQFPTGWIGAIGFRPYGRSDYRITQRIADHAALLDILARRFVHAGPVRVFVLDSFFRIAPPKSPRLLARGFDKAALEPRWALAGSAGLTIYPVSLRPGSPAPKALKNPSAARFGMKEIATGGSPGAALTEAWANSALGSVITLDVPLRRNNILRIHSANRRKLFERPLQVAPATEAGLADPALADAEMSRSFCRIVPLLPVQSADVTPRCGDVQSSAPGNRFLRLGRREVSSVPAANQPRTDLHHAARLG